MRVHISGVLLVAVGLLAGFAMSSVEKTAAAPPVRFAADSDDGRNDPNKEIVAQLKEIKQQLKDTDAFLRSGRMRVVVVMNPD